MCVCVKAHSGHALLKTLFTGAFPYSTTLQHLSADNICLSLLVSRLRTGWNTMPSIPPSRPKTGHSYEKGPRPHVYRKGRVFDRNVYNSIHGQKGKVIAYNKKIAEQVVINNLLKLRFVLLFLFTRKRRRLPRLMRGSLLSPESM